MAVVLSVQNRLFFDIMRTDAFYSLGEIWKR